MRSSNQRFEFVDVTIERIVPNGYGIGFANGLTVFVSLAVAGDVVRARITQKKGRVVFAEIEEILQPSEDRAAPACEYFGRCGGCDFQQMNYAAQIAAKSGIIRDSLRRIGKIEWPHDITVVASPSELGYRSRAQWHLDLNRRRIGYFRRSSHDVIDIESCPVLTTNLSSKLDELRENLDWSQFWSDHAVIEAAATDSAVSVYSRELVEPTEEVSFEFAGNRYFYDAKSFFQGNLLLVESLVNEAVGGFSGSLALDLYCGVGLFALPLTKSFDRVIGVEANERSIESAQRNADFARVENASFHAEAVGEWLSRNGDSLGAIDLIVLDPPRAGTEKETIVEIVKLRPQRISYVSCEPSTLARDLGLLGDSGYAIESIRGFDLFPQTHHVETVVKLKLSD